MRNQQFKDILKSATKESNWFLILLLKPNLYLFNLLKRTIVIGIILFFVYEISIYLDIHDQPIPTSWHSTSAIVIGLLLVFRTNTAYDRWWEARKLLSALESNIIYFKTILSDNNAHQNEIKTLTEINNCLFDFLSEENKQKTKYAKEEFIMKITKLSNLLVHKNFNGLEKKINDLSDIFTSLERIKETPIPISYSLHIKISLFAYLLSLPFGLFFGFGWSAIPMVMFLFFIIAGIEIISNEIENPFKGDPNDIPLDFFRTENNKILNK